MEVANVENLLVQPEAFRESWKASVRNEAKLVASSLQIEVGLFSQHSTIARKRTGFHDEDTRDDYVIEMNEADESPEEAHFLRHIFYVVMDNVIGGFTLHFSAARQISDTFSFLWNYQMMSEEELRRKAAKLAENYSNDISSEDIFYVVMDNVIGGFTLHFSAARQISDTFSFLWNYQMMSKEELRRKAAKLAENYSNVNRQSSIAISWWWNCYSIQIYFRL